MSHPYRFVTDYVPTTGVPFADKPVMGCTCEDGCRALSGKCCPHKSSADFAYTKAKRTRLPPGWYHPQRQTPLAGIVPDWFALQVTIDTSDDVLLYK